MGGATVTQALKKTALKLIKTNNRIDFITIFLS
jgi:hypothetical protein